MAADDHKPKPVYAPVEQSILPGMKRDISQPPKDWRKWTDGRGEKLDAPKYRGPMSGGKIVPPLVDVEGRDIRLGSYQVLRDTRSGFRVVDWSLPLDDNTSNEEDEGSSWSSRIMGRTVFTTKVGVQRAIRAMVVLHRVSVDRALGRPVDPVQCVDLLGKNIMIGSLALCRYTHPGPNTGCLVIVDTARGLVDNGREIFLKTTSMKAAIKELEKEVHRRATLPSPVKKKKMRILGAPISFDASSLGGGGGDSSGFSPSSWQERTYPEPGSMSWETCVQLYARRGRWCLSAQLISSSLGGELPAALVEEAQLAREEYLATEASHAD